MERTCIIKCFWGEVDKHKPARRVTVRSRFLCCHFGWGSMYTYKVVCVGGVWKWSSWYIFYYVSRSMKCFKSCNIYLKVTKVAIIQNCILFTHFWNTMVTTYICQIISYSCISQMKVIVIYFICNLTLISCIY